jgi:hypothetical protein
MRISHLPSGSSSCVDVPGFAVWTSYAFLTVPAKTAYSFILARRERLSHWAAADRSYNFNGFAAVVWPAIQRIEHHDVALDGHFDTAP